MKQLFVELSQKVRYFLFFFAICGLLSSSTGCGMWKKPWKNPWSRGDSHQKKYGKELPDAPLYQGRSSENELVEQAAVLRHTTNAPAQESQYAAKEEKKKWYQIRPFMSSKASQIDNHLGE